MATSDSTRGTPLLHLALCSSFLWLVYSSDRRSLIRAPWLSGFLISLIAATLTHVFPGLFLRWLPGVNRRFEYPAGDETPLKDKSSHANVPQRARRVYNAMFVVYMVTRLAWFVDIKEALPCWKPGAASFIFIPLILVGYELLPARRGQSPAELPGGSGTVAAGQRPEGRGLGVLSAVGSGLLCCGLWLSMGRVFPSTLYCSSVGDSSLFASLQSSQFIYMLPDMLLFVAVWRMIAWTQTARDRLKAISGILLKIPLYVLFSGPIPHFTSEIIMILGERRGPYYFTLNGFDSLYFLDVLSCGVAFATFFVSSGFFMCESSPAALANLMAFLCGLVAVANRLFVLGSWEQLSGAGVVGDVALIMAGFSVFLYTSRLRAAVSNTVRTLAILLMLVALVAAVMFAAFRRQVFHSHPVQGLVYDARVEADRWLVHATVSKTLPVAVREYRDRHHGRDPPKGFDKWYDFATKRDSVVIDHFGQIDGDVLPFWGMEPARIREGLRRLEVEPDMAILVVKDGVASMRYHPPLTAQTQEEFGALFGMLRGFSQHLPDLEVAINLNARPRVLAPWEDVHRHIKAAVPKAGFRLFGKRAAAAPEVEAVVRSEVGNGTNESQGSKSAPSTTPIDPSKAISLKGFYTWEFRDMVAETCPPSSKLRSVWDWNTRGLCSSCVKKQSHGQYLKDWALSTDLCHQPDMLRLHGFFLSRPDLHPFRELLPVFSRAKTGGFSDLLLPWPRRGWPVEDGGPSFGSRRDALFWRGAFEHPQEWERVLEGGQQGRLVHLVNNASASDEVTICAATKWNKDRLQHERVRAREMNKVLPFDVGFSSYASCAAGGGGGGDGDGKGQSSCKAPGLFGQASGDSRPPTSNRYVLLLDSDSGPPPPLHGGGGGGDDDDVILTALESGSLPFVSTIFRSWYSERLRPWAHFVPVDVRFHALHSTLAYFTGLKGRGPVNGRDPDMDARLDDAEFVAEQGRRWAGRVVRREDAEIYLFRLLLEWGRVMSDEREEMRFVLDGEGG